VVVSTNVRLTEELIRAGRCSPSLLSSLFGARLLLPHRRILPLKGKQLVVSALFDNLARL